MTRRHLLGISLAAALAASGCDRTAQTEVGGTVDDPHASAAHPLDDLVG